MLNYKGIFYKEEKEKKYYEGGAHFKYSDLVRILLALIKDENKNLESKESKNSNDSKLNLISSSNKIENIKNEENENEKKINSNLLTINNNPIKNNIKIINTHKYVLNTEKNIDKEKAKKKRLMELLNYNLKISNFKKNTTKEKKVLNINSNNSIDQNYRKKSLKTLENNDNFYGTNNYLNININNKRLENNNLPLIQSSYYNNMSNKNMFNSKNYVNDIKNNIINLKHVSKFTLNKTKISKDNAFLKNKILSPFKNVNIKRNNAFSKDFNESYKNYNNYDTINIYTKNNDNFNGKLAKYLNHNKSKQKKTLNIKLIQYALNKKNK